MVKNKPGRSGGRSGARPRFERGRANEGARGRGRSGGNLGEAGLWLYGTHAVRAALENPERHCQRLILSAEARSRANPWLDSALATRSAAGGDSISPESDQAFEGLPLPAEAVHQGVALLANPLPSPDLGALLAKPAEGTCPRLILALDRVSDPHNLGAILRSAAAFGAFALITAHRHAPQESGSLAKAASGALDIIPWVRVSNLSQALLQLRRDHSFFACALDERGDESLTPSFAAATRARGEGIVLALGAEGSGVRRLVRERCDATVRIPLAGKMQSLNVSNAAAVALHSFLGPQASDSPPLETPPGERVR